MAQSDDVSAKTRCYQNRGFLVADALASAGRVSHAKRLSLSCYRFHDELTNDIPQDLVKSLESNSELYLDSKIKIK